MSEQVRKLSHQEVVQEQVSSRDLPREDVSGKEAPVKDIRTIMIEIRERIKVDLEGNRDKHRELSRKVVQFSSDGMVRGGDLQNSEELRQVNSLYPVDAQLIPAEIATHRGGLLGKFMPFFKRTGRKVLRRFFLADYLNAERLFTGHLIRYLNQIGYYVDVRDNDLTRMIDRVSDEQSGALLSLRDNLESLIHSRLGTVDEMIRGLEGIVNNFSRYTAPNPPRAQESKEALNVPDPSYLLLENRYRGSEVEIARRLSIYPEIFTGAPGPVLEIGPGRGELQKLLNKSGIPSYGVDMDTVMVNVATAAGCDVKLGDGIAHLRAVPDASLGGLVAVQVVEHLTHAQIRELCDLAKRKLKPGSKVVFETINPQSLLALSSNYFRDPTHVWPMHPDTLGYTATLAGLKIVETRYLSPVAPNSMLKEIPVDRNKPSEMDEVVKQINQNMEQLNKMLFGYQDYALVLEVV